jgi:hypothetical protein
MNRCVPLLAALAALASGPAQAQAPRSFPAHALRGELVVQQPPQVLLNGQPARLAPGARIVDAQNLQQLSGTLVGQRLTVNYTRDNLGQPLQVWVLTPDEASRKPWPATEAQAKAWSFDAAAQRWTPR